MPEVMAVVKRISCVEPGTLLSETIVVTTLVDDGSTVAVAKAMPDISVIFDSKKKM